VREYGLPPAVVVVGNGRRKDRIERRLLRMMVVRPSPVYAVCLRI
jgi:hypothetical protein